MVLVQTPCDERTHLILEIVFLWRHNGLVRRRIWTLVREFAPSIFKILRGLIFFLLGVAEMIHCDWLILLLKMEKELIF